MYINQKQEVPSGERSTIKRLNCGIKIPFGILISGHVTTAQFQKMKMEKKPRNSR